MLECTRLEKPTGLIRILEVMLKREEDLHSFRHGCSVAKAKDNQFLKVTVSVSGLGLRDGQGRENARTSMNSASKALAAESFIGVHDPM